jgi:hypothetical protein
MIVAVVAPFVIPDASVTVNDVAAAAIAAVVVDVAYRGTFTRIVALLAEPTAVTVPVSDSLTLVTPARFTPTVEPVVMGNVEVPVT